MNTVSIQKYFQYCMGFGYLDKKSYADDVAMTRATNRTLQSQLDLLMKSLQTKGLENPERQAPPPPFIKLMQNLGQRGLAFVLIPAQMVLNLVVPVAQNIIAGIQGAAAKVTGSLEMAMSKVLSFFFGYKKDRKDEQERRDKEDFPQSDLFTRRVVEASAGAGDGASGK